MNILGLNGNPILSLNGNLIWYPISEEWIPAPIVQNFRQQKLQNYSNPFNMVTFLQLVYGRKVSLWRSRALQKFHFLYSWEDPLSTLQNHGSLYYGWTLAPSQLCEELARGGFYSCDRNGEWWRELREKVDTNTKSTKVGVVLSLIHIWFCAFVTKL